MKNVIDFFIAFFIIAILGAIWSYTLSWSISNLFNINFTFKQGIGATGLIVCLKFFYLFWKNLFISFGKDK